MPANSNYKVSAWTAKREREHEYTTTSGAKCLLRDLEMEDIIELGIINEMDSLSALVQTEHIDRVAGKTKGRKATKLAQQKAEEAERRSLIQLMSDKEKFGQISNVLNKIVMRCVISPQILDPWITDPNIIDDENPEGRRKLTRDERDPDAAYIDYIDLPDKMAIFGKVFQSMDNLEKFREESQADLGSVEDESGSPADAVRSDGADE